MPSQTEGAIAARERVLQIIRNMSRKLYPILIHVCGLELSASSWAALAGESERSGLTILRFALDDLLDMYRPMDIHPNQTHSAHCGGQGRKGKAATKHC
jgi:hypothetical protein